MLVEPRPLVLLYQDPLSLISMNLMNHLTALKLAFQPCTYTASNLAMLEDAVAIIEPPRLDRHQYPHFISILATTTPRSAVLLLLASQRESYRTPCVRVQEHIVYSKAGAPHHYLFSTESGLTLEQTLRHYIERKDFPHC
jgi:hypothetical protein